MTSANKSIPVHKDMWTSPSETGQPVQLIADQCNNCSEIFFPRKENGICTYCQSEDLSKILLSPKGKIYNHTVIMQKPPEYYHGRVPYAIGFVELPEGIRIRTHFTGCDFKDLAIGMEVELVIEKLGEDETGNDIISYMFKPAAAA